MEMTYAEVDKIAKMVPNELHITLDKAIEQNPELKSLIQGDPRVKDLIDAAKRLEGLARHASTHAAGVVISPRPLTEFVPLYKSSKDEITTMYPMTDVEKIGLLKMDFLALTTLTVIDDTLEGTEAGRHRPRHGQHLAAMMRRPTSFSQTVSPAACSSLKARE